MSAEAVQAAVSERFPQAATATDAGSAAEPAANEFVIFSKPELGRLDDDGTAKVWDLFAGAFADYGVRVHRVKILTGPELEAAGAMQQHYGVINQISRVGRPALTEAAEQALQEQLRRARWTVRGARRAPVPGALPRGQRVRAGHAVRQRRASSRLGPGTYAARLRMDADQVIVLNGFHPRQLGFFTADGHRVRLPARQQRHRLGGPAVGADRRHRPGQGGERARSGGRLKADPAAYGLATVNSNFNGVHMSAGPLEGLGELDRFFGEVHALAGLDLRRRRCGPPGAAPTTCAGWWPTR